MKFNGLENIKRKFSRTVSFLLSAYFICNFGRAKYVIQMDHRQKI